ncbi:MAG: phytanoyl-CoA dioxygenase family protein [Pseudomonadota bacterium]
MAYNATPLRNISEEDQRAWIDDGVVCLRNVFSPEWLESMRPSCQQIADGSGDFGLLPTMPGRYMTRTIAPIRRFIFESPLGEAAARVMQSSQVRFFFDELFAKPPNSDSKTLWHSDRMGWPVVGDMVPSLWIPLHPVSQENCLEVIPGSHRVDYPHWLFSPNARKMIRPDDRPKHPDEDKLRSDPQNRFVNWEMETGDMLVIHPWTMHHSSGNTDDSWRLSLSVRVFGEDIRWAPRPDCVNLAGVSFDEMLEGEPPTGPLFPLLWSDDGDKDTDEAYPRGFATTWSRERRTNVNDDALFKELLEKEA